MTQLRDLLAKATPRPWHGGSTNSVCSEVGGIGEMHHKPDVALIVAAVNALPTLLDVADAAQARKGMHSGDCVAHTNRASDEGPTCICGQDDLDDALAALKEGKE